jgi:myo-inositol-1(or 4)-monophosphatase
MLDYTQLADIKLNLERLSQDVSAFIRTEMQKVQQSDIEVKDMNSLVTYVDKNAEIKIVEVLKKLLPGAGYITEEGTVSQAQKELMWVIDPLDGTTNFLYKIPHFSISIALTQDGVPILGIVYDVMLDVAYTAIRGHGTYENNRRVKVRNNEDTLDALIVTGFPYKRDPQHIDASLQMLRYCVENCRGIRRLGSAALDLAYVASGKIDLYYENTLNIWDLAAGALLVTEAGGIVSDYHGGDSYLEDGSIIASSPGIYDKMYPVINEYLG